MSKKFHINSNGDVKPCAATVNACQFGDDSLHFENESQARKVAEDLLSSSTNPRLLVGKKRDLASLQAAAKAGGNEGPLSNAGSYIDSSKRAATAKARALARRKPVKPPVKVSRADKLVNDLRDEGFREIDSYDVPREIKRMFAKAIVEEPGSRVQGYFKDRLGNFSALSYSQMKDSFSTWTAPPTKDIPLRVADMNGWTSSLHPKGPRIEFLCGSCKANGSSRIGDFPFRRQGDFRIRCRYCNQLNTVPLQYS